MTDKQKFMIDVLDYVRKHATTSQRGPFTIVTVFLGNHEVDAADNDAVEIAQHRVARKICQSTSLSGYIRRILYPKQSSKTTSIA